MEAGIFLKNLIFPKLWVQAATILKNMGAEALILPLPMRPLVVVHSGSRWTPIQ